jgi:hypothetical protein
MSAAANTPAITTRGREDEDVPDLMQCYELPVAKKAKHTSSAPHFVNTAAVNPKTTDRSTSDVKKDNATNDSKDTYWNRNGKYQKEYNVLYWDKKLVPPSGKCDTVAGEILRAATKLLFDIHNFGPNAASDEDLWPKCGNNTSDPLNYLLHENVVKYPDVEEDFYLFTRRVIHCWQDTSSERRCHIELTTRKMCSFVNLVVDRACEFINDNEIVAQLVREGETAEEPSLARKANCEVGVT